MKVNMKMFIVTIFLIAVEGVFAQGFEKITVKYLNVNRNATFRNFSSNKGADVASAATSFTLGNDGNYYDITGTTGLDSIAAQTVGKIVVLQFDDVLTMTDGGNLLLAGDFVTIAGATIMLQSDGTDWIEVGRSGGSLFVPGTLEVDGILNVDGGITFPTATPVIWATGGSVILVTGGNDTAPTDGPRWFTEVQIPYNVTLTGIAFLVGSVGGTDSVVVDLYNSAGVLVASSIDDAVSGPAAIVAATATIQSVAFTSTYAANPGKFYISIAFNGTTARFRTYTIPGSPFIADTQAGTFRTAASITPGTTFTANQGPISMVY